MFVFDANSVYRQTVLHACTSLQCLLNFNDIFTWDSGTAKKGNDFYLGRKIELSIHRLAPLAQKKSTTISFN